eukprot:11001828-Alexandrium_andersonii.AAC.1
MSASLVGSEMCIRDSSKYWRSQLHLQYPRTRSSGCFLAPRAILILTDAPVSYTHLTLPTICSV